MNELDELKKLDDILDLYNFKHNQIDDKTEYREPNIKIDRHTFKFPNNEPQNDLQMLMKLYPTAGWDFISLSENPNITVEFILLNPSKPWDAKNLYLRNDFSENDKNRLKYILQRSALEYNFSKNEKNKLNYIAQTSEFRYDWDYMSYCKNHGQSEIKKIPKNPHFQENNINDIIIDKKYYDESTNSRGSSLYLTDKIVLDNKHLNWDAEQIMYNHFLSFECYILLLNIKNHKEHLAFEVYKHPKITIDYIIEKKYSWNDFFKFTVMLSNISFKDMISHSLFRRNDIKNGYIPFSNRYESEISFNTNLTWKDVYLNENYKWDFSTISKNLFLHNKKTARYKAHYKEKIKEYTKDYLIDPLISIINDYVIV